MYIHLYTNIHIYKISDTVHIHVILLKVIFYAHTYIANFGYFYADENVAILGANKITLLHNYEIVSFFYLSSSFLE